MKVKAYELMIFNYVYENGEILLLDKWEFKAHVIDGECKKLVPIPLTEGWIKSLGFIPDPKSDAIGEYTYEHYVNSNNLNINVNPNINAQTFGCVSLNGKYITDCNYVHQLQNLYHALTHEELTINLTEQ